MIAPGPAAWVDLFWLPLGAGGHVVRVCGRVYEWAAATLQGRSSRDLYHAALEVCVPEGRFVIEQGPALGDGAARGVVADGPVAFRLAGRSRLFRYEVRRWRDGSIADIAEAVDSPRRLTIDPAVARRLLEPGAGEMWNSNSIVAWLLARSGVDVVAISPPGGGRAPGWSAGARLAGATPAESPQPAAGRARMDDRRAAPTVHPELEARRPERA
jgi:hypothetical protein